MKFADLRPGAMRECVDHYRIEKRGDGGGGYTRVPVLQTASMRVAWEDRTPTTTVEAQSLGSNVNAEIGLRRSVDVRADDWILHFGYVYRVIRPRKRYEFRWQIVALEYIDEWDAARLGLA